LHPFDDGPRHHDDTIAVISSECVNKANGTQFAFDRLSLSRPINFRLNQSARLCVFVTAFRPPSRKEVEYQLQLLRLQVYFAVKPTLSKLGILTIRCPVVSVAVVGTPMIPSN